LYYQLQKHELCHSFIGSIQEDGRHLFESLNGGAALRMRPEVQQWLEDEVGRGDCSFLNYGSYEGYDWYAHPLYQAYVISFRDPVKAMLFRLTWG
jgi:hypothetical protein